MNFQNYPMDRQRCYLEMESYGYSEADIVYNWGNNSNPLAMTPTLNLAQFNIIGIKPKTITERLSTGNTINLNYLMLLENFKNSNL